MQTSTVPGIAHTDPPLPAAAHGSRARAGTEASRRGRGALTTPEHLIRITEAAAVAAVEAFYRPGAGSRVPVSGNPASQAMR